MRVRISEGPEPYPDLRPCGGGGKAWGFLDPNIRGAKQGQPQDFGSGGGTSDKISYSDSSQVLYCNSVAKISVLGEHSAKMYSSKTFESFSKNL